MPTHAADFPDAVVCRRPNLFEVREKGTLKIPSLCVILKIADTRLVHRVHDLTKKMSICN